MPLERRLQARPIPLIETERAEESRFCSPDRMIEREQILAYLACLHNRAIGVRKSHSG